LGHDWRDGHDESFGNLKQASLSAAHFNHLRMRLNSGGAYMAATAFVSQRMSLQAFALLALAHFVSDHTAYCGATHGTDRTAAQYGACYPADGRTADGALVLAGHARASAKNQAEHCCGSDGAEFSGRVHGYLLE